MRSAPDREDMNGERSNQPGIRYSDGTAEVRIWAPAARSMEIELNKPGSLPVRLALSKGDGGYWTLRTENNKISPGDRYYFVINGDLKRPDPASLSQPDGVHEASEVVDLSAFQWTDSNIKQPPLSDYIIYELHTGTFTPEGTFETIIPKLDHLIELGINAIEIMPVAQFPGERNWGYDGVFPYAVQNSYGGAKGLATLVDACHSRGIAVILDVVYNHLGPEGNYFGDFGPYFTDKYHTPWGQAINFDDAWCDGVREYFIRNALMWFRDFHIDALRLDAVHAIKDLSATHLLEELKIQTDKLMQETGRTHYLIAELDLNDPRFIREQVQGGYGLDAQWVDEFHHALRVTAGGDTSGYYSDFKGIEHLAKAFTDAYVYDGQWSEHRKKKFGRPASGLPGSRFIVFSQNHDQVGNRMLGERSSQLCSFEMQKLMAAAVICSPFVPMLFMGEEWGETRPFQYFVSHTDKDLAEAVRNGRKVEFSDFHLQGEAPDPMAVQTFLNSCLDWDKLQDPRHRRMFGYYQALISLRKCLAPLSKGKREDLSLAADPENNTLVLHRHHGDEQVCFLMNFSTRVRSLRLTSPGLWQKSFDSASPQWDGPAEAPDKVQIIDSESVEISLQPESVLIYHSTKSKGRKS